MNPLNLKAVQISAALRDLLASNADPYGIAEEPRPTPKFEDLPEPPKTGTYNPAPWLLQESVHVPLDPHAFDARANGELDPDLVPDEEYFMDVSAADDYGPETEEDRALHARAVHGAGWKPKTHGPHQWGALGYCTVCGLVKSGAKKQERVVPVLGSLPDVKPESTLATAQPAQVTGVVRCPNCHEIVEPGTVHACDCAVVNTGAGYRVYDAPPTPPATPRSHDQGSGLPPEEADQIEPLVRLLHDRRQLVEEWAVLKARHGDGGTWVSRRHNLRAALAEQVRQKASEKGTKLTEAAIEEAAEANPTYLAFVDAGEVERTRMFILDNEITSLTDRIRRGNGLIYSTGVEARGPNG